MHRALNDILWSANASQLQPQSRREKPQSHLKQPQSHHDSSLTTTDSAGQSRELGLTIDASSNNLAEEVSRLRELILTLKDEARTASQQSEASHRQTHSNQDAAAAQAHTASQQSEASHRQTHSNQDAAAAQLTSALQTMREENHREQREAAEASRQALQDALGSARPADVQPLQEQLREADRLLAILNEARRFPQTPGPNARNSSSRDPSPLPPTPPPLLLSADDGAPQEGGRPGRGHAADGRRSGARRPPGRVRVAPGGARG